MMTRISRLTLRLSATMLLLLSLSSPVLAQQPDGSPSPLGLADMGQDLGLATAPSPSNTAPSVAQQLNEAFSQVEAIKEVVASFEKGVVTLKGQTTSPSMRDQTRPRDAWMGCCWSITSSSWTRRR